MTTAQTKLLKQLALGLAIGLTVRFTIAKLGWHTPSALAWSADHSNFDLESSRVFPALVLWIVFSVYWSIASLKSAPTERSETRASTAFHQIVLLAAMVLLFWGPPGLNGWFLPKRFHFVVAAGAIVQTGFLLLAVWARRHLGRNWSAEVRIAVGHELVRTGPYRFVRHPIYTAMLGMFLGTAIASSQVHALVGLAMLLLAYVRKTRLEEAILLKTFGAGYDAYRRDTWALLPPIF